jgi:hypothetical protein
VLLSSVLLPVAIFLHVFSLKQVLQKWKYPASQFPAKDFAGTRQHVLTQSGA